MENLYKEEEQMTIDKVTLYKNGFIQQKDFQATDEFLKHRQWISKNIPQKTKWEMDKKHQEDLRDQKANRKR